MAASRDVIRANFARYVRRALSDAHARGLTDLEIARITGVGTSTFHRWKRGEFTAAPSIGKVRAFCEGLGIPVQPAMRALGMHEAGERPVEPEPDEDPDVKIVMRALRDPNVSAADKAVIRGMLELIAQRARTASRPSSRKRAS